jgi:hypothetical protein
MIAVFWGGIDVSVDVRSTTEWIRSSRCGPKKDSNCVELRHLGSGLTAVRDSKCAHEVLRFTEPGWLAFLAHCRSTR